MLSFPCIPQACLASHPPSSHWERLQRRMRYSARLPHRRREVGKAPSHETLLYTAAGKPSPRGSGRGVRTPCSPLRAQQHRAAWLQQQLGALTPVSPGDPAAVARGSLQSALRVKAPRTRTLNLSQTAKTCTPAGPRTDGPSYSQGKAWQTRWRFRPCFPTSSCGEERRQQSAAPWRGRLDPALRVQL